MFTLLVITVVMFAVTAEAASLEKRELKLDFDEVEIDARNLDQKLGKRKGKKKRDRKAKIPG